MKRRAFSSSRRWQPIRDMPVQAGLSLSHFNEWSCQAWESWEAKEKAAYECARRARALDPDDAVVQVILGKIEQYRRQHAAAGGALPPGRSSLRRTTPS